MADDPKRTFKNIRAQQKADIEAEREREVQRRVARQRARRDRQPPPDGAVEESPNAQWVRDNFQWQEYPGLWTMTVNNYEIASWSDYSGTAVERSNGKALMDMFPDLFEEGFGGHGTVWVGIPEDKRLTLSDEDKERLEDVIRGVADYPVIDDDELSRMEMEGKWEAWQEYGRDAVREGFVKRFNGNVNAQIAVVLQTNEFWDNMCREHGWDQYIDEEPGGSYAIHEKSMVGDIGEDEIVNADAVENWKRMWFLKNHGREFEQLLGARDVLADNDHALWVLFKQGEEALGADDVWEVKDRFHADKDEADPDDYIDLRLGALEEIANLMADKGNVDRAWKAQWANDPRQQRLPGFESQAHELATALLEEDPKSAWAALRGKERATREVQIVGRRWFRPRYGGTYFTADIYVNGEKVHEMPMEYGYGDQYLHRSFEWLEQNGYIPLRPRNASNVPEAPWRWAEKQHFKLLQNVYDVKRQRDL